MTSAHSIASSFDRGGMAIAGAIHGCLMDARQRQADADYEQAARNLTATQRAVHAVALQRRDLVSAQKEVVRLRAEKTALRTENARLKDEFFRMRSRALEAEARIVRAAKEAAARRAA